MPETLIGLIETPVFFAAGLDPAVAGELVDVIDEKTGVRLPLLELYTRVQVLRVLPHEDQIDRHAAEETPHARIVLAGPNAGVQPQFLAKVHVDAAETGAHGRRDGRLEGTARAADALRTEWGRGLPVRDMMSTPAS